MNKFLFAARERLQPIAVNLLLLGGAAGVLVYRLGSLTGGLNKDEAAYVADTTAGSFSIDWVLEHSLYLPYNLAVYGLNYFNQLSQTSLRALSAIIGMVAVVSFYLIIRNWFSNRLAILSGLLLLTSSWFLQISRLGLPSAMYLLLIPLVYLLLRMEEGTQRLSIVMMIVLIVSSLLYVPAMIWLILFGAIWQRKRLRTYLQEIPTTASVFIGLAGLIMVTPLIAGLVTTSGMWQTWLGYPGSFDLRETAVKFVTLPWQLSVRQPVNHLYNLGNLPWLDAATAALLGLGIYRYAYARRLDRVKLMAGGLVFGGLVYALWGPASSGLLIFFVYLLVAGGLALLLQQWFTVFPKNPLARATGLTLLIILVGITSFYHLHRYFIAWPQTPETRAVYQHDINLLQ